MEIDDWDQMMSERLRVYAAQTRLSESLEHQIFRFSIVATKQSCGGKNPVAILGNQPLCANFGVFRYLLPDIHSISELLPLQ